MNRSLRVALLAALSSTAAFAALKEGDTAPPFTAPASLAGKGFSYSLADALKKGPVVVYFYPAAYTAGCNIQAHTFAVNHERFAAAGASIVGVSLDDITRLNQFSADPDYCAGKIAVASDADGRIARAYDLKLQQGAAEHKDSRGQAIGHDYVERTTFVITPDGRVAATVGGIRPEANVAKALEVVRGLAAQRR